jgi:TolB-like protein/DNA-binding winged helix-turn-helix (wHTH) protein/cytochrome c-type biogenesis protein CcmH/NrfG
LNFRFSDFEVDLARRELRRAGAVVHTEPQVFDLLVHLIRNRDRIVRRNELIDVIWQGRIVSETALSSRINAARRALGDNGNDQGLIRTLHKRGFRFVGDVDEESCASAATAIDTVLSAPGAAHGAAKGMPAGEPLPLSDKPSIAILPLQNTGSDPEPERFADDLTAAGAPAPKLLDRATIASGGDATSHRDRGVDAAPAGKGTASTGRRTARNLLFAVPLTALASLLWWQLSSPSPSPTSHVKEPIGSTGEAESPADRLTPLVPSMFVRPFINLSGDAKQDYVADGITDSLISDLSRALPGIPVVSRDTAFTYKGGRADARQIGRELGVRYLLEGSVALEGERVRVNIHLVETKEGSQLWSDRFDTERNSILQVQDEIVSRVSRAIGLKVVDIEARRSWRERPSSAEFVDLIMRGRAVLNRPSSPATMIDARNLFDQALEVQPDDPDALAGVATTLVFEFLNGYYETEGDKRLRTAQQLLDRALQFEPRHLMALKAQAALRRAQGKLYDAIAAAEAVIMENPGEPWAYKEIGLSALYLGRPEQALDWFAKADRIGPRDPGRWTWLDGRGHALILLGRDEEAIRALTSALDANPRNHYTHAFLAAAYAQLGNLEEARAALATYLHRRSDTRISTFRRYSPVPLALTSPEYRQQRERLDEGLRKAGMPE